MGFYCPPEVRKKMYENKNWKNKIKKKRKRRTICFMEMENEECHKNKNYSTRS